MKACTTKVLQAFCILAQAVTVEIAKQMIISQFDK